MPRTRDIRVGLQLRPSHQPNYQRIRDAAARVEDLGVDVLFNWDHFFPLFGDPDGPHFECWTMLAAWAEQTERIQLAPLVSCVSYRNPDLLADMARTVDHISGGRLILGLGAGWKEKDYAEYGYEFGTAGSRIDYLGESLPRIKARLAKLNPPPVDPPTGGRGTAPLPILLGGSGEKKTLRLVAQHADIWHGIHDNVAQFVRRSGILAAHGKAVGRDVSQIERSVHWPGIEHADTFADAGASLFTLDADGPDYDLEPVMKLLAWRDQRNAG